jgi:hypothetical protein
MAVLATETFRRIHTVRHGLTFSESSPTFQESVKAAKECIDGASRPRAGRGPAHCPTL